MFAHLIISEASNDCHGRGGRSALAHGDGVVHAALIAAFREPGNLVVMMLRYSFRLRSTLGAYGGVEPKRPLV